MKLMTYSKAMILSATLSALTLAPVASADDTEIFFGQSQDAFNTNPNVLFILDTSGSMGSYDGKSTSRMDRMKVAMRVLLRDSSSYNVGLMGFSGSNRGGSIHYPIGDLEADSGNLCPDGICPDERVVVRPVNQSDDATQDDDTNVVTLNVQALAMGDTVSTIDPANIARADEVTKTVLAVAVSAEYENADADPTTRAIVGPAKWFFNGITEPDKIQEDDRYAYRFEAIDIPEDSIVTSANISFIKTNAAAQTGNLSALIKLEATATPDPLPDGVNAFATIESRLVNATRGIQWNNIPPNTTLGAGTAGATTGASAGAGTATTGSTAGTTTGTTTTAGTTAGTTTGATTAGTGGTTAPANAVITPDLAEIMNLIVTLPTWEQGNAMSFILDPVDEYIPSASDIREFYGIDAVESLRPVLTYSYAEAIDTDITTIELEAVAHLDEITEQNTNTVSRNLTNTSSRILFAADTHFPRKLAFRFDSVDIPSNAEIQSATLTLGGTSDATEEPIADWAVDLTTVPVTTDPTAGTTSGSTDGTTAGSTAGTTAGTTAGSTDGATTGTTDGSGTTTDADLTINTISINVAAELTGDPALYSQDPLSTRTISTEFEAWENIEIIADETVSSPNLEKVISAVVNVDTWSSGDDLSIVLSAPDSYNNTAENSAFIHTATGAVKPKLSITWKAAEIIDNTLQNTQTTALRFPNVHVPPGATVKSARLVFTADKASNDTPVFTIAAENASASEPLTAVANDINRRIRTDKKITWPADPWEFPGEKYNSIDFQSVVQEVVTLAEWCGGNPMTIFLEKTGGQGNRYAVSRDQNEISAPALEITYEPGSVPPGAYCSNTTFISSVASGVDDATEDTITNAVDLTSASLDSINPTSGNKQVIGLRFPGLGIPKDAAIVSATLNLTLEKDIATAQDYIFKAVDSLDNLSFNNIDAKVLDTSRPTYATTVTASAQPGTALDSTFMVDVAPLINAKVSDDDWVPGKPVVITAEALGDNAQSFYSFDGAESTAPQLIVYYQSQREKPGTLFRDNLIAIVDGLIAQDGTPIVSTYFEAAQYYIGESVDYGLQRGNRQERDRFHRVSHPNSYINGEVERQANCQDSNLNAEDCRYERINSKDGLTPTYISPIQSECQQNHIVLLSDGQPTSNTAAAKVRNLTGDNNCVGYGSYECGEELAEWLNSNDMDPVLEGIQNVKTHTIGFNLSSPQFLKDIAAKGGGGFYEADSASQLLNAFKNIFINVSKTDTSFVAPSATVSQSNRLKNRDDIYYSLFKPEGTARWAGNLKRYRLGSAEDSTANILDVRGALAIDERTGRFFSTAKSFWSNLDDGDSVLLGGAAEKLEQIGTTYLARNVYTFTGSDPELSNNDLLSGNEEIDRAWLKLPATVEADTDYVDRLLDWAHGKDEFDIDGDGNTDEARAQMGDPMHSQPLLLNYVSGKSVVHVATNEGYLHAIDHATGFENFAFMPKELLKNIRRNYENQPTRNRPYGLDGGITSWIQDVNKDGLIDPLTDKAYLYIGMRRGGNLYYALDVSDPNAPKYLWSIAGGADTSDSLPTTANGDFTELGDTWSKPIKTKIFEEGVERDVLIFGAGYGSNQDPIEAPAPDPTVTTPSTEDNRQKRSPDTVGRGFFIVDATTGEKLWNTEQLFYPEMLYSVPSDLRVIDINFDGMVDQIYFGDMGGRVWRFDYNNDPDPNLGTTIDSRMEGDIIARFAEDTPESARRFYYPPDIALLSIDGQQQLSISIGSGWRAHPLDDVVEDRFYNFRMKQVYGAPRLEDGEIRYPEVTESRSDMKNLLEVEIGREGTQNEIGWYLPLRTGEKVLSSSVTIDGDVVFTSYIPSMETGSCAAAIGSGSVYFMDAATGDPVKNLDGSDDSPDDAGTTDRPPNPGMTLTANDRYRHLSASGIPPQATVLFPELGKATAFAGRDKLEEVEIETLKSRTFWQEMVEENL